MTTPEPAYLGTEPYAFVSYAHANADAVYAEIIWLQRRGIRVWYDASGIGAGTEWSDEIASAIKSASVFVYFVTPESVASEHCRRELSFAQNNGCPAIAVHLEHTHLPDGLRLSLDNRQAILRPELEESRYREMLVSALAPAQSELGTGIDREADTPATRESQRQPVKTLMVVGAAALLAITAWFWPQSSDNADPIGKSIAVLPFLDLSVSGDQQHFGDGMADEIINALTELDGLKVAARTSSFIYRDRQTDLRDIAHTLGVSTVLEGSIRHDGKRLRITAQLVNAVDGFHLWSDTYERELDDLFAIQREIAQSVAATLGVTLGVGDINAFRGAGTSSIEAFEGYQRALTQSRTDAIRTLKRVVEIDPDYAAAWAMLGVSTAETMWEAMPEQTPDILDEATPYLLKAVELENESAYAYSLLAVVNYVRMDWVRSEEFFQQALAISPEPDYVNHHANMLMRTGRTSVALQNYQAVGRALRDDRYATLLSVNTLISLSQYDLLRSLTSDWAGPMLNGLNYLIAINERDVEALKQIMPERIRSGPMKGAAGDDLMRGLDDPVVGIAAVRSMYEDSTNRWPSKYHDLMLLAAYFGDPQLAVDIFSQEARRTTLRMGALWYPVLSDARQLRAFRELITEINLPRYWRTYGWSDHCWSTGEETFECR